MKKKDTDTEEKTKLDRCFYSPSLHKQTNRMWNREDMKDREGWRKWEEEKRENSQVKMCWITKNQKRMMVSETMTVWDTYQMHLWSLGESKYCTVLDKDISQNPIIDL